MWEGLRECARQTIPMSGTQNGLSSIKWLTTTATQIPTGVRAEEPMDESTLDQTRQESSSKEWMATGFTGSEEMSMLERGTTQGTDTGLTVRED